MIVHRVGQDTRETFEWVDNTGVNIDLDELAWSVVDADDAPVTCGTVSLDTYTDTDDTVRDIARLLIADDDATPAGNYVYTLKARTGTDWQYLSAGLLRIKAP